ncbi:hypothetical protein GCM10009119_24050 [Algoriphagus jejuensis]|uniref:Uncharacterized protein n=1 Tax=Algoriphagus jejuensis TaxID=419934 RepID=A0ABP3YHJ2_9BACT
MDRNEFRKEFMLMTVVQEVPFEQWSRAVFFLANRLSKDYDDVYQEAFYIRLHDIFSTGLNYARGVLLSMKGSENTSKVRWFEIFIPGIEAIRNTLTEPEYQYIQYRRHCSCHMFQDKFERVQRDTLKVKSVRNGIDLKELNAGLLGLLREFGSDKDLDAHLNSKLAIPINDLYKQLT